METVINILKKSPLFNLSLSSKELFHSNFLYWIGQNYPLEFGKLFAEYLSNWNSDSIYIAQIETKEAVLNIEEILSTPEIDGVMIGPRLREI